MYANQQSTNTPVIVPNMSVVNPWSTLHQPSFVTNKSVNPNVENIEQQQSQSASLASGRAELANITNETSYSTYMNYNLPYTSSSHSAYYYGDNTQYNANKLNQMPINSYASSQSNSYPVPFNPTNQYAPDVSSNNSSESIKDTDNECLSNETAECNKENSSDETSQQIKSPLANNYPAYFTTQKIVNNTTKLSYTVYQLEILNDIYKEMKYPNSVQKTMIANIIGITRDQVKVNKHILFL